MRFRCVKSCSGETRGWNALDLFGICNICNIYIITSNLTRYGWTTGVCEYSQTKRKESKKCPRGQKKKHCILRTIYPPPGVVFKVSIVATLGSLGLRKGGQTNGPPKLGNWWSYKSPQIWPRCIAVPENVPTHYMMHIYPIPHHRSRSRSSTFANIRHQNQKASKGGVFEDFHLSKTNIPHMHAHFKGEIKPKVAHLHQGVVKWLPIVC